ncbi:hypothetical protein [Paenibacillus dakarensis]|uniref:hypothetical protein n=1 Tax=Paenibacillus dakarensis TaxID=1527293 RepID=UPI0006D53167|nr:hypothetical protein [Paenibacillus dakarensis]
MKTIALWSPLLSGSGATAIAASLPIVLASEFKLKTLLLHGGAGGERVEQAFTLRSLSLDYSLVTFQDRGMSAVKRLAASGRLMPENLRDYTASILPERLDLLEGMREDASDSYNRQKGLMTHVIEAAARSYDVIVADAGNGNPKAADQEILNAADVILIGLNQNIRSMERVFEEEQLLHVVKGKTFGFVLGRYDGSSHCTVQNIKRRFGVKGIIEGVPYCSQLTDAWNMRTIQTCIQRGRGGLERKRESPLYHALRNTALTLAEQLGLPTAAYTERGA